MTINRTILLILGVPVCTTSAKQYIPSLDLLTTSLKFLQHPDSYRDQQWLPNTKNIPNVQNAAGNAGSDIQDWVCVALMKEVISSFQCCIKDDRTIF
jgi:hypothetical protein